MYKIIKKNYYEYDHETIIKRYNLTRYLNDICVSNEYYPVSVYYSEKPNRKNGHQNYFLLSTLQNGMDMLMKRGMDLERILPLAIVDAMVCEHCKEVIYSCMRHDAATCSCGKAFIDGGKDYVHCSMVEGTRLVKLNILTDEITENL